MTLDKKTIRKILNTPSTKSPLELRKLVEGYKTDNPELQENTENKDV